MIPARGYAADDAHSPLRPFAFEREEPRERAVQIEVLFFGVCHSDIHQVKNEWTNTVYPCVPGHEVVGRVTKVGDAVTAHAVGDIVGVGCMIDSCRHCEPCKPEVAAPILCAGVTTYSPMKHWGVKAGQKVGIIG